MHKILFIFILFLTAFEGEAKTVFDEPDSTQRLLFPQSYGEKKWKVLFGLDARRSYFNDQKVKINGLRIGAQYKGVHRFGLGFYALSQTIIIKNSMVDMPDAPELTTLRISLGFSTLFYERVLFKVPKWEVSLPLYIGTGKIRSEYLNNLENYKSLSKTPYSLIGLGVSGKYYLLPWLAPRVTVGHRFTYNTNADIRKAFNKPFYAIGLSISLGELYRSIFKKMEKDH